MKAPVAIVVLKDHITPAQRLRPPSRVVRFFGELWLRYQYRVACWEIDRQQEHQAAWRWVQLQCQDKLKQLGVDPNAQPEDITKIFEVWIVVALVLGFALAGFLFSAYREALLEIIQRSM